MRKERVYIVLSHKNSLKKKSKTQWEVTETVEFVNQLRDKHLTMSSACGDYLDKKMIFGARFGFDDYKKFDTYIRSKYEKEMAQLDSAYKDDIIPVVVDEIDPSLMLDEFGNMRTKTVFDQSIVTTAE